jgi:hypothetical protein
MDQGLSLHSSPISTYSSRPTAGLGWCSSPHTQLATANSRIAAVDTAAAASRSPVGLRDDPLHRCGNVMLGHLVGREDTTDDLVDRLRQFDLPG